MDYDFTVVGAGVSGLLTALALGKEGKNILLLEKENYAGGVCRSYDVDGYTVDTGPHIVTRLEHGPLKKLMDQYFDYTPIFVPHGKYYVRLNGRVAPFPWNLKAWLSFDLLPRIDRLYLMKSLFSVSYLFTGDRDLNKISVGEYIGPGISPETKKFLDCLSYFLTGTSMNETPVARFIDSEKYKTVSESLVDKIFKALMKEGATDQTYPRKGIQSIVDSIRASMPDTVEVMTGAEVNSITTEGAKKTVSTDEDNYSTKNVIYSGFASELPQIVKELPNEYSKGLEKMKRINSVVVWLGLNKKVFEEQGSEIWADREPYSWVVPTSNYDPSLAPRGKQLVGFAFIRPEEYNGNKDLEKKALDAIYDTLPEIESSVDMIHYQHLVPEKAAWTVDSVFAGVKTPVDGLYLVGTDTEKRSMGITRASYSVLNLLDTLREDRIL